MTARQRPTGGPARLPRAGAPALGALTVYPGLWVLWLSLQHRIPIFGISRFAGVDHYALPGRRHALLERGRGHRRVRGGLGRARARARPGGGAGLQRQRRGRRLAVALLLLAWALPSVVTAKLFEWLYHPAAGLVNLLLGGRPLNWLGDPAPRPARR